MADGTIGLWTVPLAVFEQGCLYRNRAIHALEAERHAWHVAYTSPSIFGIQAAVSAGLGVFSLGDLLRGGVGQRSFEPVIGVQIHLAVLHKDEQDCAVSAISLANAPRLRDTLRVIFDRGIALHFRKNRDHDLIGSVAFELRELFIQAARSFL